MSEKIDGRTRAAKTRRKRTPFGVMRLKMSLDAETMKRLEAENKIPRWINDDDHGQRIMNAREGDYEFVESVGQVGDKAVDADRRIRKLVGSHKDGSPKYAYLMAIPKEFYEEDQKAKEAVNQQVDDTIRAGSPKGSRPLNMAPDQGGTYVKDINYTP